MARAAAHWAAYAAMVLAAGCASLPPPTGRVESGALADTEGTALGKMAAPLSAAHPGLTGIHALPVATDAFAVRVLLAQRAQRSIDAQYYIWHADETGMALFEALAAAARRGVRVRLLLDDQNTRGIEDVLAALAREPNFEVRLYNPFASRHLRATDYLGDFSRLNRRMHNKAFVADNQAAVIGGRNIGNEYFGAGDAVPFRDLDVLAIGAAVPAISRQFDAYWNSQSAYPAASIVAAAPAVLDQRFAESRASEHGRAYADVVRRTPLVESLPTLRLPLEWAQARLVHDDPAKTLDTSERTDLLMLSSLLKEGTPTRSTLDMISPYFVPGEKGSAAIEELARSGVRIRVLTNSLAGTDAGPVHAGYAKRRCALARAGVRLYELKPDFEPHAKTDGSGSSKSRLHAKTYAADGERIFVGSFNFDPRSALLNTEMGLVIGSRDLAGRLGAVFDGPLRDLAYEVRARSDAGCIEWVERSASGEIVHTSEPGVGLLRRAWISFLELLPIDWML